MKRLFLALEFPKDLSDELEEFLRPYKTHPDLKDAKWVPKENYHLTTLFLGDVPDSLVPEVQSLARGVCAKIPRFIMTPKRISLFPEVGVAKKVWVKFERSLEYQELCKELLLFLKHTLPDLEIRESIAHLTVARLRSHIDGKAIGFKPLPLGAFEVTESVLFESKITSEGSTYSVLERYSHDL